MRPVGALAGDPMRAFAATVNFGAGLARGLATVAAGQAGHALHKPEARRAAGWTEGTKLSGQFLCRQTDVVHARGVGMGAYVGLEKNPVARRLRRRPGEGSFELRPVGDPLADARVVLALWAHHQVVLGKPRLPGEGLGGGPIRRQQMGEVCLAPRRRLPGRVRRQ